MQTQTVKFAITRNDGTITRIASKFHQITGQMVSVEFDSLHAHFNRPLKNQSYKGRSGIAMVNKELSALQPILDTYYADNAKKLHIVVDRILSKFGGLSNKDLDDFYSLANEVFADIMKKYDDSQLFDGFLYTCLSNKIMTEITKRNREKRKADRMAVLLDATNESGEECCLLDFIPSGFDTFEEVTKRQENGQYRDKVQQYISKLSNRQVNILNLLVDGYEPYEIRKILEISPKEYTENL